MKSFRREYLFVVVLVAGLIASTGFSLASSFKGNNTDSLLAQESKQDVITITEIVTFGEPEIQESRGYDFIRIDGCGFLTNVGGPSLPTRGLLIELPSANVLDVSFEVLENTYLHGRYFVCPAQPPVKMSASSPSDNLEFVLPDHRIYNSTSFYPGKIGELYTVFDREFDPKAYVRIFPVQYLPSTREVLLYRKIKVTVTVMEEKAPIYSTLSADQSAGSGDDPVDYLIITRGMFTNTLENFIEWKKSTGLTLAVENVDDIANNYSGRDVPEKIRNCINQHYTDNGVKWVLLVGDADNDDGPEISSTSITTVAISSDDKYIVIGGSDDNVRLFENDDNVPLWTNQLGGGVSKVAISSDGSHIVAGHGENISVFDNNGVLLWSYQTSGPVKTVDISEDNEYVVGGNDNGDVYFFKVLDNLVLWSYEDQPNVSSVSISSDGSHAAVGVSSNIYLFDNDDNIPIWSYEIPSGDQILSVSISSDDNYIVVGSSGVGEQNYGNVYLFRKFDNNIVWSYETTNWVMSTSISSDGSHIVAGTYDGNVYLFDNNSNTPIWSYEISRPVGSVTISNNDNRIVVGSSDDYVRLFNNVDNVPLWSYQAWDTVNSVSISSDGSHIVEGGYDGCIRLFDEQTSIPSWVYDSPPTPMYMLDKSWEIPVRYVWNVTKSGDDSYTNMNDEYTPTDFYYAALSGDWDADNDNRFGESPYYSNQEEADFIAEVYVGRWPVRAIAELETIITKTINFENSSLPPSNFLIFGARHGGSETLDENIKAVKENIRENIVPNPLTTHAYYELDNDLSYENVINAINIHNPSFINSFSHGSPERLSLYSGGTFESYENKTTESQLANSGFIQYAFACLSNAFDISSDAFGENIFKAPERGAVAYLGGTRIMSTDWDAGVGRELDQDFWDNFFNDSSYSYHPGCALYGSKVKFLDYGYDLKYETWRRDLFTMMLLGDPELSLPWWNLNWSCRRPITITNDHPENYQIKIDIDYDNDMMDNYQDLRFLEDEAAGVLDFWIENYAASNVTVWVRRLENSDNTIYVYYGNPDASSVSSGPNTFILFDNFDNIDTAKWNQTSGWSILDGVIYVNANDKNLVSVENWPYSGNAIHARVKTDEAGPMPQVRFLISASDGVNPYQSPYVTTINSTDLSSTVGLCTENETATYSTPWDTNWHNLAHKNANGNVAGDLDNENKIVSTGIENIYVAFRIDGGLGTVTLYIDHVFIRKYVEPDPTATVGDETKLEDNEGGENNWWDNNWSCRRPITIDNDHPENYQLQVHLPYDDDMKSDFSDIRFLENENSGELSYWIENLVPSTSADVWVLRLENNNNIDDTIYVYYGNPSASSEENENLVFDLFDNFNAGATDTNKWEEKKGGTGAINYTATAVQMGQTTAGSYAKLRSVDTFQFPLWVETFVLNNNNIGGVGVSKSTGVFAGNFYLGYQLRFYTIGDADMNLDRVDAGGGVSVIAYSNNSPNVNVLWRLEWDDWGTSRGEEANDQATRLTGTNTDVSPASSYVNLGSNDGWWVTGTITTYDWVRVRRFADPEPYPSVGDEMSND